MFVLFNAYVVPLTIISFNTGFPGSVSVDLYFKYSCILRALPIIELFEYPPNVVKFFVKVNNEIPWSPVNNWSCPESLNAPLNASIIMLPDKSPVPSIAPAPASNFSPEFISLLINTLS